MKVHPYLLYSAQNAAKAKTFHVRTLPVYMQSLRRKVADYQQFLWHQLATFQQPPQAQYALPPPTTAAGEHAAPQPAASSSILGSWGQPSPWPPSPSGQVSQPSLHPASGHVAGPRLAAPSGYGPPLQALPAHVPRVQATPSVAPQPPTSSQGFPFLHGVGGGEQGTSSMTPGGVGGGPGAFHEALQAGPVASADSMAPGAGRGRREPFHGVPIGEPVPQASGAPPAPAAGPPLPFDRLGAGISFVLPRSGEATGKR